MQVIKEKERHEEALKDQIAAHDARAKTQLEEKDKEYALAMTELRKEKQAEIEAIEKERAATIQEKGRAVAKLADVSINVFFCLWSVRFDNQI